MGKKILHITFVSYMGQIKKCISISFKTEFNTVPHHLSSITVIGRATLQISNQHYGQHYVQTREALCLCCVTYSPYLMTAKVSQHAASMTCRWAALSCWEGSAGSELEHSEKAASVLLLLTLLLRCLFNYKINILLGVLTAADLGKIKAHCP